MSKRRLGPIIGIVTALALMGAQPAAASTQVGNQCAGNESAEEISFAGTANAPGNPFPAAIPSAGVVTKWTFNVGVPIPPGILSQTLKIFRPTGGPGGFQVVGESTPGLVSTGLNSFGARIPVQAGDLLGTTGFVEGEQLTLYCVTGNPGDRAAVFVGNPTPGATAEFIVEGSEIQVPIIATVEPDADNDGFGDETQDQCPQSASTQAPCPLATLSASAVVRKGLATILITSNVQAPVTVAGKVNLGKGKKVNLNGGTQVVVPGTIAKFTILFPARLKEALKGLSRKQFLTLALTATAPNIAGAPTVKKVNVKAKGQKKPARKGKRGKGKGGKRG